MEIRTVLEREILPLVEKPGRYIGGEYGAVVKGDSGISVRIALAFPDVYEIGMSHLGLKILYTIINGHPSFSAERVYAPWPDMEALMRRHRVPLYGLESFRPISEFDLVGFSLPHELTYTNILTMLDLAGIPLSSRERTGGPFPLVIAGGPCACNPGPLEDFVDFFIIGEGEEALLDVMSAVDQWKRSEEAKRSGRKDLLIYLARTVKGAYVPELYRPVRSSAGVLISREPLFPGVPARVKKRVVSALRSSQYLAQVPVPNIAIVHDRVGLEVRRGCSQGCRFCQAGMIYRPVRDELPENIRAAAGSALDATGYDEVALCALSVGDYPDLESVAREVTRCARSGPVALSLPSLRPDLLSGTIADSLSESRRTGITLAPEVGSEAMRRRVNKNVSMENLTRLIAELKRKGWRLVKLYFMVGLPGETEDDLIGIADWIGKVAEIGGRRSGKWEVNVTLSSFIPKPHTPFQWEPMNSLDDLRAKQDFLRKRLRQRNVRLKFHDLESSFLEGVFSRGASALCKAISLAWGKGCRFDGWRETFKPQLWREAFQEAGLDPVAYALRRFDDEEFLPWEVIDIGVSKKFLLSERLKSVRGELTADCALEGCMGCGVCESLGVRPVLGNKRE